MSMLPLIELKGAIPIGISMNISPIISIFIALVGSCIPAFFILNYMEIFFDKISGIKLLKKRVVGFERKMLRKSKKMKILGKMGILTFVAIPLPGTGVWSGSVIAVLMGIRPREVIPYIVAGNMIAACIISVVSYGVINVL